MRLRIERRGGLAGLPAVCEADAGTLTPDQRRALAALLAAPPATRPAPGADRFHYMVWVEDATGTRVFSVAEDAMPEALAAMARLVL